MPRHEHGLCLPGARPIGSGSLRVARIHARDGPTDGAGRRAALQLGETFAGGELSA